MSNLPKPPDNWNKDPHIVVRVASLIFKGTMLVVTLFGKFGGMLSSGFRHMVGHRKYSKEAEDQLIDVGFASRVNLDAMKKRKKEKEEEEEKKKRTSGHYKNGWFSNRSPNDV